MEFFAKTKFIIEKKVIEGAEVDKIIDGVLAIVPVIYSKEGNNCYFEVMIRWWANEISSQKDFSLAVDLEWIGDNLHTDIETANVLFVGTISEFKKSIHEAKDYDDYDAVYPRGIETANTFCVYGEIMGKSFLFEIIPIYHCKIGIIVPRKYSKN